MQIQKICDPEKRKAKREAYYKSLVDLEVNYKKNIDNSVISGEEIYMFYSYKTMDPKAKSVYPYVKKADRTDHKHTLNYKQWSELHSIYSEILLDELYLGNKVSLPQRMGSLQLLKYKIKNFYRYSKAHIAKFRKKMMLKYSAELQENYGLLIKWEKPEKLKPQLSQFWLFKLNKKEFLDRYEKLDYFTITNFNSLPEKIPT